MIRHAVKFLRTIGRWICTRFRKRRRFRSGLRIISESNSKRGRLVEVQRSLQQAVATWKFIPTGDSSWDLLLCLDRWDGMQVAIRENFDAGSGGPSEPYPTHVLSVIRIYRVPGPHGSIKTALIFYSHLDLGCPPHWDADKGDYKARKIIGAVAKSLHRYPDDEIDWASLIDQGLALWDEVTYSRLM